MAHIIDRVKFDTLAILNCEPLRRILAFEFAGHAQAGSHEQNYLRTEKKSRSSDHCASEKPTLIVSI
jgi:hypothetical protein